MKMYFYSFRVASLYQSPVSVAGDGVLYAVNADAAYAELNRRKEDIKCVARERGVKDPQITFTAFNHVD